VQELCHAVKVVSELKYETEFWTSLVNSQLWYSFLLITKQDALIIQIYPVIKLHMFRASSLSIIRSFLLHIRHWEFSCRFLVTAFKQSQDGTEVPSWLCLEAVIINLHETYQCRMYSRKLLMMGREDARNM